MKKLNWILFAIFMGVYLSKPLQDPDLWWHVTVGRWIVANHWVPYHDHWNAFAAGKPWIAYSWSQEVIFALIDQYFGIKGLFLLQMILFCFISLSLCYVIGFIARDYLFGLLIGGLAFSVLEGFVLLRPQSFVWLYFIWIIYFIVKIIRNKGELTLKSAFGIMGLMCLWANSHITTVIGFCFLTSWLFKRVPLKSYLIILTIGLIGTLFTPYGGLEWFIFFSKADHPLAYGGIVEFGPATIRDYGTGVFLILLTLLIVMLSRRYKPLMLGPVVAVIVLSAGGLGVVKFLPFAVITLAVLIAECWSEDRNDYGELYVSYSKLSELIGLVEGRGLIFLLAVMIYLQGSKYGVEIIDEDFLPVKALDFFVDKQLPAPILNNFGQGGYIMYRLSDQNGELDKKVSIDGRTNVNPKGIAVSEARSLSGSLLWREYFDQVNPNTLILNNRLPIVAIIVETRDWCRVYCDGTPQNGMSIFVKRSYFEQQPLSVWQRDYCSDVNTTCVYDAAGPKV